MNFDARKLPLSLFVTLCFVWFLVTKEMKTEDNCDDDVSNYNNDDDKAALE